MKKEEVWLADLPQQSGKEREGRRTVLILSDTRVGLTIILPFTSTTKLSKYDHNITISRSNENGLRINSTLSFFQIRSLDKKRLVHKMGILEPHYMDKINKNLRNLLQL